jgi:hypothetical protein
VALLLGISLITFVLFEVYKMVVTHRAFLKQGRILAGGYEPRDFLARLEALKIQASESSVTFMRMWGAVMVICVGAGLAAVGVLFYNFFALLLGLPLWPTG